MKTENQIEQKSTDLLDVIRWVATTAVITIHVVATLNH